mmetsp:Transcript_8504/g.12768  ORF Transcript_8504/g.12768 Transcript_8504/m.12768 type:complete len:349 (-) Transcript_8504:144-1190(-)
MCQLLGISSTAASPTFSSSLLSPFVQRGGNTDCHSHGWGVAYYNYCDKEKKLRLKTIRDASPAATSVKVQNLILNRSKERILESQTLLVHIRYATVGEVAIQNVHPFHRELFGVEFVFAHNGDVPMFKGGKERPSCYHNLNSCTAEFVGRQEGNKEKVGEDDTDDNRNDCNNVHTQTNTHTHTHTHNDRIIFEAEGDTDSEQIFCYILNALHAKYDTFPLLDDLYNTIHQLCLEISQKQEGVILNFLLGFGEYMFAYSWPGSRPGSTTWNGLYYMLRDDGSNNNSGGGGEATAMNGNCCELGGQSVAVIATKPLGAEPSMWTEMERGDLLLFQNGTVLKRINIRKADQ